MSNWDNPSNGGTNGGWPAPPPGGPSAGNQWQPGQKPKGADGTFALAPLTVADVLDLTFSLLRKSWRQILPLVLLYAVPAGVLSGISAAVQDDRSFNYGFFGNAFSGDSNLSGSTVVVFIILTLLSVVLSVAFKPFIQGAITRLIAAEYLGREMQAKEALLGVKPLFWRFLLAYILVYLILGFGFVLLLLPGIAFGVLLTAVTPVIAIEEEKVGNAIGRSWALMKLRFWSYLAIRFVMYLIAFVASLLVQVVPIGLAFLFFALNIDALGAVFMALGSVFGELIAMPIGAIVVTLIYFDARVRFEGFDLQMMAARIPQSTTSTSNELP